jgi:predicted small secreted protein
MVALLVLGAAGASAGVYFFIIKPRNDAAKAVAAGQVVKSATSAIGNITGLYGKAIGTAGALGGTALRVGGSVVTTAIAAPVHLAGQVIGGATSVIKTGIAIPTQVAGSVIKTAISVANPVNVVKSVSSVGSSIVHGISSLF